MKATKFSLLIAATVAIASIGIAAEMKVASPATDAHKVYDASKLEWGPPPPGFPAGAQAAVLYGNPGEKGVYTVRLKAPAGYKIMPHTHPTAELVTVISGGFHVGMGGKFDESAGEAMTAGGFVSLPAKMQHFAWCTARGRLRSTTSIPRTIRGMRRSNRDQLKFRIGAGENSSRRFFSAATQASVRGCRTNSLNWVRLSTCQ